jgi:hypothetical protein
MNVFASFFKKKRFLSFTARDRPVTACKQFFFEKKNQKTFINDRRKAPGHGVKEPLFRSVPQSFVT